MGEAAAPLAGGTVGLPGRRAGRTRPPRAGSRRRAVPALAAALAVATAAAVNVPLVYLGLRAVEGGVAGWWQAVASDLVLRLLGRTVALAGGVLVVTLAIAVPVAWLVARTDLPGRRLWAVAAALPLVFPSYVAAFTLVAALGPQGYAQGLLARLGLAAAGLPPLAYGYSGALLALGLFIYPYVYLLLVAALRDLDPALEECSRSLGAGRWRTFFGVVLPQLRPALHSGSLLVVLYTLSDFGAVSIARYNTFTLAIYNAYRALFDRGVAASLATVLVLLTVGLVVVEARLGRRLRPVRSGPVRPARPVPLGRWKWPALAGLSLLAAVNLGVPLGVILYWGARALVVGNPLGVVGGAVQASLAVSAAAALAAAALALAPTVWALRQPGRLSRFVERAAYAGYALPGIVVALALVFVASRHLVPLYHGVTLLVAAYVIRFLPEALASTRAALAQVAPAFEEAARSLGRRPFYVLRTVVLPLVRPGLAAGAGLVFMTAMKELPATLILRPTGMETLATRVWSAAGEGIFSQAALPALLLVAVTAPPVWLLVIRPALAGRRRSA